MMMMTATLLMRAMSLCITRCKYIYCRRSLHRFQRPPPQRREVDCSPRVSFVQSRYYIAAAWRTLAAAAAAAAGCSALASPVRWPMTHSGDRRRRPGGRSVVSSDKHLSRWTAGLLKAQDDHMSCQTTANNRGKRSDSSASVADGELLQSLSSSNTERM